MTGQNELLSRGTSGAHSQMAQSAKELAKKMRLEGEYERVELNNIPMSIIEALYHEITGKTEEFSTNFYKTKKIDYEQVNDIFARLQSTVEKYKPIASSYSIQYALSDGRRFRFSDWLKFSSFDYKTMARSNEVVIEIDFLLKSEIDTPSSYKITVEMGSGAGYLEHHEYDQLVKWWKSSDQIANVRMKAEYVNSLVMKDFYAVIKEWYNNLHDSGTNGAPGWLKKIMRYNTEIMISVFVVTTATSGIVSSYVVKGKESVYDVLSMYAAVGCATICTFFVSMLLMGFAMKNFFDSVDVAVIKLTAGDSHQIETMAFKNGRRIVRFWIFFVSSLISIMLNMASSAIYERL